jgi:hypothetical protein
MHRFLRHNGFLIERVDYPFFETRHFTEENLLRMLDTGTVSPPFYGNFMTFYCRKPVGGQLTAVLQHTAGFAAHELAAVDTWADAALRETEQAVTSGGFLRLQSEPGSSRLEELARDHWNELEAIHDHRTAARVVAGAGDPASPEDVVLRFSRSKSAARDGVRPSDRELLVAMGRGPDTARRRDRGESLQLPVFFGHSPAAVEVLVTVGLLNELWSRLDERSTVGTAP